MYHLFTQKMHDVRIDSMNSYIMHFFDKNSVKLLDVKMKVNLAHMQYHLTACSVTAILSLINQHTFPTEHSC